MTTVLQKTALKKLTLQVPPFPCTSISNAGTASKMKSAIYSNSMIDYYQIPTVSIICHFQAPRWFRRQRICLQCGRPRFNPWVGKIPWRRARQPTPGESWRILGNPHRQRRLEGCSPWGRKEPDTALSTHTCITSNMFSTSTIFQMVSNLVLNLHLCGFMKVMKMKVTQSCPTLCDSMD